MMSIRKWLYKPKKTDGQLLAQFYFSDEELNAVSQELDSFDGRQDPERCTLLVNRLRSCQDKVLAILEQVMDHAISEERANRDFRAKFPDDVLQDSLAGQLWFGAECLAAGSTIMNREIESAALRPLARGLTRSLDVLRCILREQCYKNLNHYSDKVKESLRKFDEMFAEFELSYVSAMVPVKTAREYNTQQDVIVLFCETMDRALKQGFVTQERVDDYDPALMFTIPRLAIVSGLLIFPDGPLNMEQESRDVSELFRPFQGLLLKIKELLDTLHEQELNLLEKALCSTKDSWEVIEHQLNEMSLNNESPPRGRSRRTSRNPDSICLSPCDSMMTECSLISSSFMSTPEGADLLMQRLSFSESNQELSSQEARFTESWEQGVMSSEAGREPLPGMSTSCEDEAPALTGIRDRRCTPNDAQGASSSTSTQEHSVSENFDGQKDHDLANNNFFGLRVSNNDANAAPEEEQGSHSTEPAPTVSRPTRLAREDSGLGSAPELEMMDLFINVPPMLPSSVEIELNGGSGLVRMHSSEPVPHSSKSSLSPLRIDSGHLQDSGTRRDHAVAVSSHAGSEFAPKFSSFGKGKPSTELSLVGATTSPTINSRHHFEFSNEGPGSSSRSVSNQGSVETPSPNGYNEPTSFLQRIRHGSGHRSSDTESSRASSPNGGIPASAINRVEGSRGMGCVPIPSHVGDDHGEDSNTSSSCSSSCCGGDDEVCNYQWESDGSDSDSTSYLSENNDELEIAMAIEAAEMAARQEMRSHFKSSSDLVHRLFVCIAGVADQLQTNYASDLRNILKTVFLMCSSEPFIVDPADSPSENIPDEGASTSAVLPSDASPTDDDDVGGSTSSPSPTNGRVHFESEALADKTDASISMPSNTSSETSDSKGQACESDNMAESTNSNGQESAVGDDSLHENCESDRIEDVGSRTASEAPVFDSTKETDSSTSGQKERKRHRSSSRNRRSVAHQEPPPWVPDDSATECTSCKALFTMLRRKHHCRNCGKIFCGRCSANSVPLPRYNQQSPVRVCNKCYMFQVTPFQN